MEESRPAKRARRDAVFARFIAEVPIFVLANIFTMTDDPLVGARLSIASRAAVRRLTCLPDYDARVLWKPMYEACFPHITKMLPTLEDDVAEGRITRARALLCHITWLTSRLRRMTFSVECDDRRSSFRPFARACTCHDFRTCANEFPVRIAANVGFLCAPRDSPRISFGVGHAVRSEKLSDDKEHAYPSPEIEYTVLGGVLPDFMCIRMCFMRYPGPGGYWCCVRGSLYWDGITDAFAAELDDFVN